MSSFARLTSSVLFSLGLAAAACGGDDPPEVAAECNPLGGGITCLGPWPSAAYLTADSSTVTGFRVDLPVEAMPINSNDAPVSPAPLNRWDGFSPSGALNVAFPGGVSADGLPGHADLAASLADDAAIVLVDVDTGERVPFFAEVDMNVAEAAQRPLIVRPVQRLLGNHRYAIGIRDTVRAADGSALPVSKAFAALRDGGSYDHPRFAALAERYPAIFDALETAGLPRDQLVLAWDFHTASDEFLTSDLLAMRSDALDAMGDAGANLEFTASFFTAAEAEANPEHVHKLAVGTFTSPDFLTAGETAPSILRRDGSGRPEMEGMRDANFSAIVPACVATAPLPIPVMIFGHGLFGSGEGYLTDGFLQQVSQDYCFVVVAGDFIGLTERHLGVAALAANDLNKAYGITEKLAQSVIDFISLEHLVRGPLRDSPEFAFEGTPIIDPERVLYFGASLGGIMGSSVMAYDPVITRGVLGVPGGPWSMLFERSLAWTALQGPARAAYPDPADFQILLSFLSMAFEPYDPITAAPHLTGEVLDPLPDTPAKQILLYETLGDSLVSNLASETLARSMGLPVVMPTLKTPYGMTAAPAEAANGFAVYDEDPSPLPSEFNMPPEDDNGTHSGVHERPAVLRQIETFLYDGMVTNQCFAGETLVACDCAAGACE